MTYKTRQEVLRAAADWMDVCEKAGVTARYKHRGIIGEVKNSSFSASTSNYEFPLALLEGKEVWVGSELYDATGNKIQANLVWGPSGFYGYSWNPPKKTVMVEMQLEDAEHMVAVLATKMIDKTFVYCRVGEACKIALEKL